MKTKFTQDETRQLRNAVARYNRAAQKIDVLEKLTLKEVKSLVSKSTKSRDIKTIMSLLNAPKKKNAGKISKKYGIENALVEIGKRYTTLANRKNKTRRAFISKAQGQDIDFDRMRSSEYVVHKNRKFGEQENFKPLKFIQNVKRQASENYDINLARQYKDNYLYFLTEGNPITRNSAAVSKEYQQKIYDLIKNVDPVYFYAAGLRNYLSHFEQLYVPIDPQENGIMIYNTWKELLNGIE